MKVAILLALILSFESFSAFSFSSDPSNILSECPKFKPKEVVDKENALSGRWYFLKYYGTRKTGATCVSIHFDKVSIEDGYQLTYSSEFNGLGISSVQNWTSTTPGEYILDANVTVPTLLGGKRVSHLYYKVSW